MARRKREGKRSQVLRKMVVAQLMGEKALRRVGVGLETAGRLDSDARDLAISTNRILLQSRA